MATVAELKTQADSLGVKYSSKVRKPELELMVSDALAARERVAASRIAPMPNDDRIIAYTRQNRAFKLTHRQTRRIRKHERRNAPASA